MSPDNLGATPFHSPAELASSAVSVDEQRRVLDDAKSLYDSLRAKALAEPLRTIQTAATMHAMMDATAVGRPMATLDAAQQLYDKLEAKAQTQFVTSLHTAYAAGQQLGLPFPSSEQVSQGLATGDYLGSLGVKVDPAIGAVVPVATSVPDTPQQTDPTIAAYLAQEYSKLIGMNPNDPIVCQAWGNWVGHGGDPSLVPPECTTSTPVGPTPISQPVNNPALPPDVPVVTDPTIGGPPVMPAGGNVTVPPGSCGPIVSVGGTTYSAAPACLSQFGNLPCLSPTFINGQMYVPTSELEQWGPVLCHLPPPPPPPPPQSCPVNPAVNVTISQPCGTAKCPCDLSIVFAGWPDAAGYLANMQTRDARIFVCGVRMLACLKCARGDNTAITIDEYAKIYQSAMQQGHPLQGFDGADKATQQNAAADARCADVWKYHLSEQGALGGTPDHAKFIREVLAMGQADCTLTLNLADPKPAAPFAAQAPDCDPRGFMANLDWGSLDVCKKIESAFGCLRDETKSLSDQLGFVRLPDNNAQAPQWFIDLTNAWPKLFRSLAFDAIKGTIDLLGSIVSNIPESEHCKVQQMIVPIVANIGLRILNRVTGGGLEDIMQSNKYAVDYACPTYIPSAQEANSLFIQQYIDEDLWKCYVQGNNYHLEPQRCIVDSMQTRPGVGELISLWRRGCIDDVDYRNAMRHQGVRDDSVRQQLEWAGEWYPSESIIAEWIRKNILDDDFAAKQGWDVHFEERYQSLYKPLFDNIGVDEQHAKWIYRNHWRQVGLHEMAETMFRLRPDKPGVVNPTTPEDLVRQLEIQDVPQFWRDRFVEALYVPLTRVDVYRGFRIGVTDRDDVKSAYMDRGYNDDNAETLTKVAERRKKKEEEKEAGIKPATYWTAQFVAGLMTEQEFTSRISTLVDDPVIIQELIDDANSQKLTAERKGIVRNVTAKLKSGLISHNEAYLDMVRCGLPAELAQEAANECVVRMQAKPKQVAASQLCAWRTNQLITYQEHVGALVRIGYQSTDAVLIADVCEAKLRKQIEGELAKVAKEKAKEAAAAAKAAAKQSPIIPKKKPPRKVAKP